MIPSCFRHNAYSDIASNDCQASAEDTGGTHQSEHTTHTLGENDWGPKFSAKDHPLAQMVSYVV